MDQGSAEETIVVVKSVAKEGVVTHLRIKLLARDKRLSKAKGGTD